MRNYYFEISKDQKAINIGTDWDTSSGKFNQIGSIVKNSTVWIDFNFKLPNGQIIDRKKVCVSEALDSVSEYLLKEDLVCLCEYLFLWG